MIRNYNVIVKLIERYDYGGALELLTETGAEHTCAAVLADSCRYAVNFDFQMALRILRQLKEPKKDEPHIKNLENNLNQLIQGNPDAVFSELLENTKFQIVGEEYIDFLGRVYRLREAIFKYLFAKIHLNRGNFSLLMPVLQKRQILKILRRKHKIYNYNLIHAIGTYLKRVRANDSNIMEIIEILNGAKMTALIALRNDSVVGHGFSGISSKDIYKAYGNPYQVISDFQCCLKKAGLSLESEKYTRINGYIKTFLEEDNQEG